jgi:hypothetical protein
MRAISEVILTTNMTDRTAWMAGRCGIMNHWLYPGVLPAAGEPAATFDEAVDCFDLDGFLADFATTGASWLIFTLGQNTGYYISPNAVLEELAGPGHCSRRDLACELAEGVHRLGKRFIAYLPCEIAANTTLHDGFAWQTAPGTVQAEFQRRYTRVVAEWARRLGPLLDGWWFDGCYTWPVFHNSHMDWPLWTAAARAGNPAAALTFNDGSFCIGNLEPTIPEHDYLSGETEMLVEGQARLGREEPARTHLPAARFVPGTHCQWHSLLPIDCFWGHGAPAPRWLSRQRYREVPPGARSAPMEPPVYDDAELGSYLQRCLSVGGAVTLNVGVYQDGRLGPDTVRQLARLSKAL